MSIKIKNNIYWVGKIDWELRKFHGDEYSTHRGSSYNSYLVKEDKVALIDTVWKPFAKEFVEKLANELIFLPFLAIYFASEIRLISLDLNGLLIIAAILSAVDIVLYFVSTAAFQREEILTKWK